jgi:hypothetical protein
MLFCRRAGLLNFLFLIQFVSLRFLGLRSSADAKSRQSFISAALKTALAAHNR